MIGQKLKSAPPTGDHVFQRIGTTFELNQDIIKTNILTNFKLGRDFIGTKLLTKFHEDGTRNQMLTDGRTDGHTTDKDRKNSPPHWKPYIIETNFLTKFHEDWKLYLRKYRANNDQSIPSGHVFKATKTIFELIQDIIGTNLQTKFHDDRKINVTSRKTAPSPGGHESIKTNVLTNFHDDWAKIVTSRVFTRKTAPPTDGHVIQHTGTTFELNQDIIKTNILTSFELGRDFIGAKLLTKFHEDGTRNVTSRVFTSKCLRTDGRTYDGQRPVRKAHLSNQVS
ncbi:hypothetical protein DPMN_178838 [Dreissena polymorpha]|uniref:Uncharacterized protein n=1 Tax=Dreissena polymorpha TaxID=45954 RepID=A0A9D4IJ14_DREPO|nr:hypothetical protein DPMN_178838 [Dreissena polymorpha]